MPVRVRWTAWLLAGLAVSLSVASELIGSLWQPTALPSGMWPPIYDVALPLFTWSFALVGGLIVSRHVKNVIGWLCLAIALVASSYAVIVRYSLVAEFNTAASLPGGLWTTWAVQWGWIPLDSLLFVFLPALFPTGRLASHRWRVIILLAIPAAAVTTLAAALYPVMSLWTAGPSCVWSVAIPGPCYRFNNPFPLTLSTSLLDVVFRISGGLQSVAILLATLSLVARYRQGSQEIRAQLKWLTTAGGLLALSSASLFVLGTMLNLRVPAVWLIAIAAIIFLPYAIALAILKHRLYDIDVVINNSLVYGALAVFITTVYVAIVVGIGHVVGTSGKPNLGLSILATALVAVAFEPVRERVQRVANRLVYGRRATPYEALSQFSDRIASSYSDAQVLPRLAQTIAESTGAAQAVIWAKEGTENTNLASWPEPNGLSATVPSAAERSTSDRIVPVQHQGELLGALSIRKARGEAVTPLDEKMLADFASPAGVVLRNLQLTRQLQARLAEISAQTTELQASSARIIAAQDSTRRRLERNIHDGAQQHLVAIAVKLRLAATLAKRDPTRAARLLDELEGETHQALETLHALARGIYPPILRELGLESAIRAQGARFALPVDVSANKLTRYPSEVEGAVYFCCLEALQNVAKHAKATAVRIRLEDDGGGLAFSVEDNGIGFDLSRVRHGSGLQNIADRLAALGGHFAVVARPDGGTSLQGRLPVLNLEPVA